MAEDTYIDLAEAVDAGAEFMDAIDPEWFWIVEPDKLDMRRGERSPSGCGCVLVQHHPSGFYSPSAYGLDVGGEFGFSTQNSYYGLLTELWREAIYDRRATALEPAASPRPVLDPVRRYD